MSELLINILLQSELFADIPKLKIEDFLSNNTYRIKNYTKNDVFALAGDRCNELIIVLEGSLIARMVSDSGKSIQMDKIDEGRIVAPAMLFATDNVFPVNVIPENDASVFVMQKNIFLNAMQNNEKLLFNFMRIVSDISKFLSGRIHSLSLKSIRGKLAEYILQESEKQDEKNLIKIKYTRQELADKFAVSRQSLIRSLTELEDEKLISVKGKLITILNKQKLMYED